jgi:hypothetical protein
MLTQMRVDVRQEAIYLEVQYETRWILKTGCLFGILPHALRNSLE